MFSGVLDALKAVHGETIVFKGDGSLTESFVGVFDEAYIEVDPDTGQKLASQALSVLLDLSDLSRTPIHKDEFEIRSVSYLVRNIEPDGKGGARVFLMEKDT